MVFVTQFFSLFAAPETILLDGDPCVVAHCVPHIAEGLVVLQKLADIKFIQTTALHKGKLYAITVFDPYFRKNNAHFVFSSYPLYGGRADALPRLFGALKMAFPRIRRQSPV